ncbi:Type II secretion system protein F [bacterium HR35]|nr:Type II secretion system protein F [bacterium HR35]
MNKKPFIFRVTLNDKINFSRNLALLLKSGISLSEALIILRESSSSKSLRYILGEIINDIERGQFLATALEKFNNKLGNFFVSVIRVGEYTGKLTDNLERLAIEFRKIEKLRSKMITSFIYPSFIIGSMIGIIVLVVYFLFPRLLPIFQNLGVELPLTTKIFLSVSLFLLNYGIYLFLSLLILFFSFPLLLRFQQLKYGFHFFLIHFPLVSGLIRKYVLAQFSRNLAILLESGLPIVEALKLSGESLENLVYQKIVLEGVDFISKGHSLGEFLQKNKKYFPYNFIQMVIIGEKSGNLANTLFYLAENYDEELDIDLERFVNSLEPLILIIIAASVGFIALAVITPIYEISNKLSR